MIRLTFKDGSIVEYLDGIRYDVNENVLTVLNERTEVIAELDYRDIGYSENVKEVPCEAQ